MVQVEHTPNPLTLKFVMTSIVSEQPLEINNVSEAGVSFLAKDLFKIEGVERVFLGRDFVAVSINEARNWEYLRPQILACIDDYDQNDLDIIDYNELSKQQPLASAKSDCEIENTIKDLIEERIRPAVAMDGGDVEFKRFEDGVVYLKLLGACAGCPSSEITLKNGIENMICYFVPEVTKVVAVED